MKQIPLTGKYGKGKFALIDDADFELVSRYKWHARKDIRDGTLRAAAHPKMNQPPIMLSNLIMGNIPGKIVDHWNHNTLDNQRGNLRHATQRENVANARRKNVSTGFRGVRNVKGRPNSFHAFICDHGVQEYLGTHHSKGDAARAYDSAAKRIHGEFAILNFS
jgi:hypothetical protein